jgi:hypothetical protein
MIVIKRIHEEDIQAEGEQEQENNHDGGLVIVILIRFTVIVSC